MAGHPEMVPPSLKRGDRKKRAKEEKLMHFMISEIIKKGQQSLDVVERIKKGKGKDSDFARDPAVELQRLQELRTLTKPNSPLDTEILEAQETLLKLISDPSQEL